MIHEPLITHSILYLNKVMGVEGVLNGVPSLVLLLLLDTRTRKISISEQSNDLHVINFFKSKKNKINTLHEHV